MTDAGRHDEQDRLAPTPFPPAIIAEAVWLSARFPLSLRPVEKMLPERGVDLSRETVRRWGARPARRLLRTLPDKRGWRPRRMVTDKLASCPAAKRTVAPRACSTALARAEQSRREQPRAAARRQAADAGLPLARRAAALRPGRLHLPHPLRHPSPPPICSRQPPPSPPGARPLARGCLYCGPTLLERSTFRACGR